jgi:DNA mismatch endonuclease (patch repair protein)
MERLLRSKLAHGDFREVSAQRSKIMGAIRSKGNKSTELRFKMALVRHGIAGWKTHPRDISGTPDFYFPAKRLAVFVDGCFWHGCTKCGHIPRTNQLFWAAKIDRNRKRHRRVNNQLRSKGICVRRFWEHEIRGNLDQCIAKIQQDLRSIVHGSKTVGDSFRRD